MSVRSFTLSVLWLWPATALAQVEQWQGHMDAGVKAYLENNYTEAEKQLVAAVKKAEQFGPQDPRQGTTLNGLAELYQAQGKYAEAEPLFKRSLAIRGKALGPEHPDVAMSLENYASLLRKTGHSGEATMMELRAKAIRAKHARQNPGK